MNLTLEELGVGNYSQLVELWEKSSLPTKPKGRDSLAELERQLKLSCVSILGLFDQDRLVASVLVTHDGRKGWINRLVVRSRYRRRGLGERLIRAAENWLESQGIGIFACIIEGGNDVSRTVFESAGYKDFEGASYFTKRLDPDI